MYKFVQSREKPKVEQNVSTCFPLAFTSISMFLSRVGGIHRVLYSAKVNDFFSSRIFSSFSTKAKILFDRVTFGRNGC